MITAFYEFGIYVYCVTNKTLGKNIKVMRGGYRIIMVNTTLKKLEERLLWLPFNKIDKRGSLLLWGVDIGLLISRVKFEDSPWFYLI